MNTQKKNKKKKVFAHSMSSDDVALVFLRGPAAVGKTTIASALAVELKKRDASCALINEDTFRKRMQCKYSSTDKAPHIHSVRLILAVIKELLSIDSYKYVIIEGLLKYEEMMEEYSEFCSLSSYRSFLFQLDAPLEVRQQRDQISETRKHVVGLAEGNQGFDKMYPADPPPKDAILLDTGSKSLEESVRFICDHISNGEKESKSKCKRKDSRERKGTKNRKGKKGGKARDRRKDAGKRRAYESDSD